MKSNDHAHYLVRERMGARWRGARAGAFHPIAHRLGRANRAPSQAVGPALATAILFGLLAWRAGSRAELLAFSCVALASVPLTTIDITELRLPTRLIWSTCLATLGLLTVAAAVDHDGRALLRAVTVGCREPDNPGTEYHRALDDLIAPRPTP